MCRVWWWSRPTWLGFGRRLVPTFDWGRRRSITLLLCCLCAVVRHEDMEKEEVMCVFLLLLLRVKASQIDEMHPTTILSTPPRLSISIRFNKHHAGPSIL